MWTDTFQIIIMLVGLLAALIKGVIVLGGVNKVIETSWKYGRIDIFA
jgi:Na+/proline symporter